MPTVFLCGLGGPGGFMTILQPVSKLHGTTKPGHLFAPFSK
jgi:hypothetical protein